MSTTTKGSEIASEKNTPRVDAVTLNRASDDVTRAVERLETIRAAVLQAPDREEEFAEGLCQQIGDVIRELEESQDRAADRVVEAREEAYAH